MIRYFTLLLFIGLAWGQVDDPETGEAFKNQDSPEENDSFSKHNLSIGMFDDRTGFSFIGYTYNLKQTDMDEYFIGGGTIIMGFSVTMGWQHYYRKSKLSISSIFSGQAFTHFGGEGFLATSSVTLEYNLIKYTQIKLGYFGGIHFGRTASESGSDIGALPFGSINFRF